MAAQSAPAESTLMSQLEQLTPDDITALRETYYHHWLHTWMKSIGLVTLVVGVAILTLGLSRSGQSVDIGGGSQLLLGGLICIYSLWASNSPSPRAILGYVPLFALSGAVNVLILLTGVTVTSVIGAFLGLLQLQWAYSFYENWRIYRRLPFHTPAETVRTLYHDVWQAIVSTKPGDGLPLVELQMERRNWNLVMLDSIALVATRSREMLMVVDKEQVRFREPTQKSTRWLSGRIIGHIATFRATLRRTHWSKYAAWKGVGEDSE